MLKSIDLALIDPFFWIAPTTLPLCKHYFSFQQSSYYKPSLSRHHCSSWQEILKLFFRRFFLHQETLFQFRFSGNSKYNLLYLFELIFLQKSALSPSAIIFCRHNVHVKRLYCKRPTLFYCRHTLLFLTSLFHIFLSVQLVKSTYPCGRERGLEQAKTTTKKAWATSKYNYPPCVNICLYSIYIYLVDTVYGPLTGGE